MLIIVVPVFMRLSFRKQFVTKRSNEANFIVMKDLLAVCDENL